MIVAVLALLAEAPVSAVPIEPGSWITNADYPYEVQQAGTTGSVGFALMVDSKGSVTACKIEQSSGSTVLDTTTCSLLSIRARFKPARGNNGRATADRYASRVTWSTHAGPLPLPRKPLIPAVEVKLDSQGKVTACEWMERRDWALTDAPSPCLAYPLGAFIQSYMDEAGKPISVRLVSRRSFEVLPQ